MIGQQKAQRFLRQPSRYLKHQSGNNSIDSLSSFQGQEPKQGSLVLNDVGTTETINEQPPHNYTPATLDALRKWAGVDANGFKSMLLDRTVRQETVREEKRLSRVVSERQLKTTRNCELFLAALNNVLNHSQEALRNLADLKSNSTTDNKFRKSNVREMSRQLQVIQDEIRQYNFASVRFMIQELLKRFGKDEFLEEKMGYLNYIQWLTEEYEKEKTILNEVSGYIKRLSTIKPSIEGLPFSIEHLKNLKEKLKIAVNRQNQKQEPNQRILTAISQVHKIEVTLLFYLEAHNFQIKKAVPEGQESIIKNEAGDIRQYRSTSKRLETQQEQRKSSVDKRVKSITKLEDYAVNLKRQLVEANLCLKAIAAVYQKRNFSGENLTAELAKCYEKYENNYLIFNIRGNLEKIIHSVQQKDRSAKQGFYQNDAKKLRKQNERLRKQLLQTKGQLSKNIAPQFLKRDILPKEEAKPLQICDSEKEAKAVDQHLIEINHSVSSKMWGEARKLIAVFSEKYKESTNAVTRRAQDNIRIVLTAVEQCEVLSAQIVKWQRKIKQIQAELSYSKQRRQLQAAQAERLKSQLQKITIQHTDAIKSFSVRIETVSKEHSQLQNRYASDMKYYCDLNSRLTSASVSMEDSQRHQQEAVDRWKSAELPKVLAEERIRYRQQFIQRQLPCILRQKQEELQSNKEYIIKTIFSENQRILQQERAQLQQILKNEKDKPKAQFQQQKRSWMLQRQLQQKQSQKVLQLQREQFQEYKKQNGLREAAATSQRQQKWKDRQLLFEQQIRLYQDQLNQLQAQLQSNITIASKYQSQASQHLRQIEETSAYYKQQLETALTFIQSSQKQKTDYAIQIQRLKDQIIALKVSAQQCANTQRKEVERVTSQQKQSQDIQILRLRAELREALERQTLSSDNQCTAGYIQVLRDIKKNAKAFKETGSAQHIEVIYTCLGIK